MMIGLWDFMGDFNLEWEFYVSSMDLLLGNYGLKMNLYFKGV
jgi:hypothetical protein